MFTKNRPNFYHLNLNTFGVIIAWIDRFEANIASIKKRSGSMVSFNLEQVSDAIHKALSATGNSDRNLAGDISKNVLSELTGHGFSSSNPPTVEDIQDVVESTLIDLGHSEAAKAFILYRHERRKLREAKMKVLNTSALDSVAKAFDINCLKILASRYLLRNNKGDITESPEQMFQRVAMLITVGDILYDSKIFDGQGNIKQDITIAESYYSKLDSFDFKFKIGEQYMNKYHFRSFISHYITLAKQGHMKVDFKQLLTMLVAKKFDSYEEKLEEYTKMMTAQSFLPNSPTMMNAGARLGQLSACFVLDMQDDMAKIMKSTTDAALIFKSGGGVGINYSSLRQEGDIVASTSGVASGPVSFMNIINTVTEVVKQGGKRRGANMGIMEVWHPDIEKFITHKTEPGNLEFNVHVLFSDLEFKIKAVQF